MLRYLFCFTTLLLTSNLKGQISPQLSLCSGVSLANQSWYYTENSFDFPDQDFLVGVPLEMQFNLFSGAGLRLGASLAYMQMGHSAEITYFEDGSLDQQTEKVAYRYDYVMLGVPIGYAYSLNDRWLVVGTLAPTLKLDLNYKSDDRFFFPIEGREKVILAASAQIGAEYQLTKNWRALARLTVVHDVLPFYNLDIRDENNRRVDELNVYQYLFGLQLGLAYTL